MENENDNNSVIKIIILIIILLFVLAVVVVIVAKHGRKINFPDLEEDICKTAEPFPSPSQNRDWMGSNNYQMSKMSKLSKLSKISVDKRSVKSKSKVCRENENNSNNQSPNSLDTIIPNPQFQQQFQPQFQLQSVNENTYIVKHIFIPKSVDELPIQKNQLLNVKEIYEDGWCMAVSLATGEMGVVPIQCLQLYSDIIQQQQQLYYQTQKKYSSQSTLN